jgi:uracil-DNA glycosylase
VSKAEVLDRLYAAYAGQLVLQRVADGKRLVRGAGPLDAPLVIVGEAPGEVEDRQGEPFVGPSGQLLQHLFARAALPWELCYRTNVLPWRPPGNRTPDNFEIVASYNRVEQEIAVIDPLVVVAAGATACQAVTRNRHGRFSDLLGGPHEDVLPGRQLWVIYHPSYILRTGRGLEEETAITLSYILECSHA